MGGQISATSRPGAGSEFTVSIPLRRTTSLAEYRRLGIALVERAEQDDGRSLRGLRVLLAEDHPTNQRVVQIILEPCGIDLTVVGNGREAVEAFEGARFDLILMDMQMPLMDGLAATREIRRLERETGRLPLPIAMLSANAMDEHRAMAAEAGASQHIAKPITPESLLTGIQMTLSEVALPGGVLQRRASASGG